MDDEEETHPFYGYTIVRDAQTELIQSILRKYKKEPPTEELKKKIWDELQKEKYLGHVTIPFKVVLRRDPSGEYPDYVEVILDTKV